METTTTTTTTSNQEETEEKPNEEKVPEQPKHIRKDPVFKLWFGPDKDQEVPNEKFNGLLTTYIKARKEYDMKRFDDLGYYNEDDKTDETIKGFARHITEQIFKATFKEKEDKIVTKKSVNYALKTFPGWPKLIRTIWVNFMGQNNSGITVMQFFHGCRSREGIQKKLLPEKPSKGGSVGNYCFSYHPDKGGGIMCSYVRSKAGAGSGGTIVEDKLTCQKTKKSNWVWLRVIPHIGGTTTEKIKLDTLEKYILKMNDVGKGQKETLFSPVMYKSSYEPVR